MSARRGTGIAVRPLRTSTAMSDQPPLWDSASSSASCSMCWMRSLMFSNVGAEAVAALRRSDSISPCIADSCPARSAVRATAASRSARAMRKSASSRSMVSATWLRSYPRSTTSNEC